MSYFVKSLRCTRAFCRNGCCATTRVALFQSRFARDCARAQLRPPPIEPVSELVAVLERAPPHPLRRDNRGRWVRDRRENSPRIAVPRNRTPPINDSSGIVARRSGASKSRAGTSLFRAPEVGRNPTRHRQRASSCRRSARVSVRGTQRYVGGTTSPRGHPVASPGGSKCCAVSPLPLLPGWC